MHKCKQSSFKTVQFFISPSAGHADVEVCALPVPRGSKASIDDIKTQGKCTKEVDSNKQYVLSFDLDPAAYTAFIYAHSDYSFVSIPALNAVLKRDHYEFQFTMQSCDNRVEFVTSDSYSITLRNTYVWGEAKEPRVTVYYTDNLKLKLKDIKKFKKMVFTGMLGLGQHEFRITGLKPFTKYQFYVFLESTTDSFAPALISNHAYGRTYDECKDELWRAVGVGEESTIECTIGYHAYYCAKDANYRAVFTTRRDPCYCPEETIHGVVYPQTQYDHYAPGALGKRYCGWMGVWESAPSKDCPAEGEWPAALDGEVVSKSCQNGGQLTRQCIYGEWQPVKDQNCKCPSILEDDTRWSAGNRNEEVTHACMAGSMTRVCDDWGWWTTPVDHECRCTADGMWEETPHNTTLAQPCGDHPLEESVVTRTCGFDGFWKDEDLSQCMCSAVTENGMTWESVPSFSAAVIHCDIGSKARLCLPYGVWDSVVANYECQCAADQGWENTPSGTTAVLPCPDNIQKAQLRECSESGVWEEIDATQCYGSCPAYGRFPVTLSGTEGSVPCEEGGGKIVMDCLRKVDANGDFYGEWDFDSWRVVGECKCASNDEFESAAVDTDSEIVCDAGSRTKKCGKFTARWEKPVNHDCQCVAEAAFPVEPTPVFEKAELACEVGSREALCGARGHFETINDEMCFCAAKDAFPETHATEVAQHECSEQGKESRLCAASGFWRDIDYSACECRGISQVTGYLPINTVFEQMCEVGKYEVECDGRGNTAVKEESCSCPAIDGFPVTPAGSRVEEQCGKFSKTAYCTLDGEWTNVHNPCFCRATELFPDTPYGEKAEAFLPQCYKGYCNAETGEFEMDYSECGCPAVDSWPAMAHGEEQTKECSTGGSMTARCSMGVTRVDYTECNCVAEDKVIEVGDYLSRDCMIGFLLKQCRGDNFWYNVTDSFCGCSSDAEGLKEFKIVPAGTEGSAVCGAGSMSIQCDATGHYDLASWSNQCKCPADGVWAETAKDSTATLTCANSDKHATRRCGRFGVWEEPASECICPREGEWDFSAPGEYTQTCASGSVIKRVCNMDGSWEPATGSCLDRSCPADGPFPITPHLGVARHVCGNGAVVTRSCTAGVWGVADWSSCGCADDDGFVSGEFIDEAVYSTWSSQPCGEGQKIRECRYGLWQEVNYDDCYCRSTPLLPHMRANELYSAECRSGSISGQCNKNGEWVVLEDTCGCEAKVDEASGIALPATLHGATASSACSVGALTARCSDAAEWERFDYAECWCAEEGWDTVHPFEHSFARCEEGARSRVCNANGFFDAIFDGTCACKANDMYPRSAVDTEASHQCGVGSVVSKCTASGWESVEDHGCSCVETEEYPQTPRNTVAEVSCGAGFEGVKTRRCLESGFWGEEDTALCVPWCIAIDEWPATKPNTTVTLPCPAGYVEGSLTRYCNPEGLWEMGVSHCTPMRCAAVDDFPTTPINGTVTRACPAGQVGSISRRCSFIGGEAVWSDVQNTCEDAFCKIGDREYSHESEVVLDCGEGKTGSVKKVCRTGVWEVVEDSCKAVRCGADEERGLPEGVYGDVFLRNCGVDYTGTVAMRCNAKQEWEHVSGTCVAIEPMLRCEPHDDSKDVALTSTDKSQYTVYCTSNVRIASVLNDDVEHVNVHIVFDLPDALLVYPTRTEIVSEYTVGFRFDGSLPPDCEGTLYVIAHSFTAMNQLTFPAATIAQSFSTRSGQPLAPAPISEASIRITAVDYAARTATLAITVPFSASLYDEAEIAFIHSNLHAVRFAQSEVVVEGAILGNVIAMAWRVRKGEYWSAFSLFSVYQPLTLLAPATPVVDSYHLTTAQWSWAPTELYGQTVAHYKYRLYQNDVVIREETTTAQFVLLSDLVADKSYALDVAACSDVCSPFSGKSAGVLLVEKLSSPEAVELTLRSVSSSHLQLSWATPRWTGGTSDLRYVVHKSQTADFAVVTEEVTTTETVIDFYQVQEPFFVRVAAFNGYLSKFATALVQPVALEAAWSVKEGAEFDNAVAVQGVFNYLCSGECTAVSVKFPAFAKTLRFTATMKAELLFEGLIDDSAYTITCVANEISETLSSVTQTLTAATRSSEDFAPVLVVDGEPTSAVTATVAVLTNMVGELTCYVARYEGKESRPTSMVGFESNWSQTEKVTSVEEQKVFTFSYDVNGEMIEASSTYHAWCVMERAKTVGETLEEVVVKYPEYSEESQHVVLQTEVFEVSQITPAELATNVDPASDIVLEFTRAVTKGAGAVSLFDERNAETVVNPSSILCVEKRCVVRMASGLKANTKYLLRVADDAFLSEGAPLEQGVEDYVFMTGHYRCDTKYVSKGLSDSRVCECFSVADRCQCECGETSVLRYL